MANRPPKLRWVCWRGENVSVCARRPVAVCQDGLPMHQVGRGLYVVPGLGVISKRDHDFDPRARCVCNQEVKARAQRQPRGQNPKRGFHVDTESSWAMARSSGGTPLRNRSVSRRFSRSSRCSRSVTGFDSPRLLQFGFLIDAPPWAQSFPRVPSP